MKQSQRGETIGGAFDAAQKWDRGVWPGDMDTQERGENHAGKDTGECEPEILQADGFVMSGKDDAREKTFARGSGRIGAVVVNGHFRSSSPCARALNQCVSYPLRTKLQEKLGKLAAVSRFLSCRSAVQFPHFGISTSEFAKELKLRSCKSIRIDSQDDNPLFDLNDAQTNAADRFVHGEARKLLELFLEVGELFAKSLQFPAEGIDFDFQLRNPGSVSGIPHQ